MPAFPFDIVGFDLDGTLFDTHVDLGHAVNHALSLAGRPARPVGSMRNLIGGGARRMLQRAFDEERIAVDESGFEAIYGELLAHYQANIAAHTRPFPGALEALEALHALGTRLALVTNKAQGLAEKLIGDLGLADRFDCLIGGGSGLPLKPAPDALQAMVARLGGGRAAFVGDTSADIDAARAAELPCVAVSFGFNTMPTAKLGADAVINHFDELVPVLNKLRIRHATAR